jgi:hypothetical protein
MLVGLDHRHVKCAEVVLAAKEEGARQGRKRVYGRAGRGCTAGQEEGVRQGRKECTAGQGRGCKAGQECEGRT